MPEQVKVEDFEAFRLFRAALLKFAQAASQSLSNADSQIARTHSWLENEQSAFWQTQFRKRQDLAVQAKEQVRLKKMFKDSSGRTPSAAEEEKFLSKCIAAVAHAEQKMQAVRRSLPRLEKATEMYRSGVSRLSSSVSGDIPKAVALLDRLAMSLEQYVQIQTPAEETAGSAAPPAAAQEPSFARGGDIQKPQPAAETPPKIKDRPASPEASPGAAEAPAAAPPEEQANAKEAGDVADGK